MVKKIIQGLETFRESYFEAHQELFEQLAHAQEPKVLFITCSDSRIDPNLITQTDPGELFVIRNAGNMIPPFGAANGGEGATVEYAVHALGVEHIIVCGHTNCGAMKGLLKLEKLEEDMPLVYQWLKHAEATRRLVRENYSNYSGEELLEITIAENVLTQIENLKTYPVIHSRLYQGKLQIYGWIYHLETGEVLAYDPETHTYIPPQSQIKTSDAGTYLNTSAPPVACELPVRQATSQIQAGPIFGKSPTINRSNDSANGNGQPPSQPAEKAASTNGNLPHPYPSWLSPEQADRIYRGSKL